MQQRARRARGDRRGAAPDATAATATGRAESGPRPGDDDARRTGSDASDRRQLPSGPTGRHAGPHPSSRGETMTSTEPTHDWAEDFDIFDPRYVRDPYPV